MMRPKKIFGWVLIALGLLIIIVSLFYSYNMFTGKIPAPEIFKPDNSNTVIVSDAAKNNADNKNITPEQLQKNMEEMVGNQVKSIIPQEVIYKILNLLSWSIFTAILFFGGGKISAIGAIMLKD